MKKQILLLMLVSFTGNSVSAALPGIDPELANFVAGVADQLNQAVRRAENAETQLAQVKQQAEEATARAAQLALVSERLCEDQEALLEDAGQKEKELLEVTEAAEELRRENRRLNKERNKATEQADDFLKRLQLLTDRHEAVSSAHREAKSALEKIALEKKQSDDEVQRLQAEVASLSDITFRVQGVGLSLPRVNSQSSAMAFLNPRFQRDEQVKRDEKRLKRQELQTKLEVALVSQQKMKDAVDEALTLVQEKDKEITTLTARAVRLQQERIVLEEKSQELENFREAEDEHGCSFLMKEDVAAAIAGAAAVAPEDETPRKIVYRGVWESLVAKLNRIVRAALDEARS